MNFISGFAGATLTEDQFVKAELSWAVAEKSDPPKKQTRQRQIARNANRQTHDQVPKSSK